MRETASKCQYATLRNFSMRRCSVKSNAFPPGSSVHGDSLGKNTRVVLRVFFQGSSWIGMKSRSPVLQGDSTVWANSSQKNEYWHIQKMHDLSTFVYCNSVFFFQLTYQSHFYSPESNLESKFFLKEKKNYTKVTFIFFFNFILFLNFT